MVCGLMQQTTHADVKLTAKQFADSGFDVAVINYRGLAGAKLTSPKMWTAESWEDVLEATQVLFKKYVNGTNRKVFAVGFSMGANILSILLGHISDGNQSGIKFDGACIIQAPMRLWIALQGLHNSLFGLYNLSMGHKLKKLLLTHEEEMNQEVKKISGQSIRQMFDRWPLFKTTMKQVDEEITSKLFNYADSEDCYYKSSCIHQIPNIQTATLFLNSLDDPVLLSNSIDYDVFRGNKNTAIATTRYGGHLGYLESIFSDRSWVVVPCVKFFTALSEL